MAKRLDENLNSYAAAMARLNGRSGVTLAGNTTLNRGPESINVRYHFTDIISFFLDGSIVLRDGGWITNPTTQHRLNGCMPEGWYTSVSNGQAVLVIDGISYRWPLSSRFTIVKGTVWYGEGDDLVLAELTIAPIIAKVLGWEVVTLQDVARCFAQLTVEELHKLWKKYLCRTLLARFAPANLLPTLLADPNPCLDTIEERIKGCTA